MINKFFTDLIGPSWRTTIYGFTSKAILGLMITAAMQPHLIDNALGSLAGPVKAWSLLIWFVLGTAKDHATADKAAVPGIANDVIDKEVKPGAQVTPPPSALVALLCASLALFGCATNTGDPKKDRAGRVTNAVLAVVGRDVEAFAFNSLMNALQQEASGGKVDMAFAASKGLDTMSTTIVTGSDIKNVVAAWSGNQANDIGAEAAKAYVSAAPQTEQDRAALATTISKAIDKAASKALAAQP